MKHKTARNFDTTKDTVILQYLTPKTWRSVNSLKRIQNNDFKDTQQDSREHNIEKFKKELVCIYA